jgi:hypothetical protein
MMTFKCDFGDGITCEVFIADEPPSTPWGVRDALWTGTPSEKTLHSYKAWMNTVNKSLADKWGMRLMHVFMLPKGRNECWVYESGKRPRCHAVSYGLPSESLFDDL